MHALLKELGKHIGIIIGGAALGLIALLLVFCIPVDEMEFHVYQSLPMLESEFQAELAIPGYTASNRGSFTDCLMLEHAIYENEDYSLLEQVLYMYRGESGQGDGWAPGYSLVDYLSGVEQTRIEQYPRYWHGYLVVLKPLLYLMSVNAIRVLASTVQFFLVGVIVMLCARRKEDGLGLAFLAAIPFLYFFTMYSSLSLSICFYIMASLLIIQLVWHEKLMAKKWYPYLFLLGGMATAYFDFLTYPLVTLGFPLTVALYLERDTWKASLSRLVHLCIEWGVGYGGMWGMKWIITDMLTQGSTIQDALSTIALRSDNVSEVSKVAGYVQVLGLNLEPFTNWAFYLIALVLVVVTLVLCIRKRDKLRKKECWQRAAVLLVVALLPFVWFFFTQNHSAEHAFFTCKILAISVFAYGCAVGKFFQE